MAKTSRTIFVLIPFILTLATLVVLILIFTGNTSSNTVARNFYFIKASTSGSTIGQLAGPLLKDWYTIGLWNYCTGKAGSDVPNFCSQRKAFFWFDPIKIWGLQGTPVPGLINADWKSALNTYQSAAKWDFIAYIAAIAATGATLVVSVCAFCRRLGSCVTSVIAIAALLFTVGGAITATVLYLALLGFIKAKFGNYGITADLGRSMFALVWLAVALSLFSGIFFLATACCCAGDSGHKRSKHDEAYERVPSPYDPHSAFAGPPAFSGQRHYQTKGHEVESKPLHTSYPHHHQGY